MAEICQNRSAGRTSDPPSLVIIKAEFKYLINLMFIRCIISIFKQTGKFKCTLESNKLFNLFHIIKVIISLNIRRYGNIIIILTLKRKVFIPPTATRLIKAISNIISRAHISRNGIQSINLFPQVFPFLWQAVFLIIIFLIFREPTLPISFSFKETNHWQQAW